MASAGLVAACLLTPSSVVVWDSESEAPFAGNGRVRKRSLIVPKSAVADVGVRGRLQTGRVLDHDARAVRLLADYLDSVSHVIDSVPLGAIPAVRNARIELVSAALQVAPATAPTNSITVTATAQRYIDANLRDPGLSPSVNAG